MWTILTDDALLSRLSAKERDILDRVAVDWTQDNALAQIAHEVAEEWRGALRRVTMVDTRTDAVPSEILIHILADFRYRAVTRLPGLRALLDENRVKEWERALAIRDKLATISYEHPAAEYRPEDEAISLPLPHMIPMEHRVLD
ncbi:MAG: hypothetical protein Q4F99_02935 [bacterium]|nr:hypothetical protein [bacterium]